MAGHVQFAESAGESFSLEQLGTGRGPEVAVELVSSQSEAVPGSLLACLHKRFGI